MSGDYSRKHFKARDNYSGVLEQQGRVHLDWEHNEASAIQDRRWRSEGMDLVGRCGVSESTPNGFRLEVADGKLSIGVGRLYVDGLQAENHGIPPQAFDAVLAEPHSDTAVPYLQQPYVPGDTDGVSAPGPAFAGVVPPAGQALAFLDVWQREVSHHQAPDLVETALGVDTTSRLQTVWQVKLLPVVDDVELRCDTQDAEIPGWDALRRPSDLRLTTGTSTLPSEDDPCRVSPEGGYRGLDNLLYRVEVHDLQEGVPRIKWSRHNASIQASVTQVGLEGKKLTLDSLGRDDLLRFNSGDWVEITDDYHELLGIPGAMRRVTVNDSERILSFDAALDSSDFPTIDGNGQPDPGRHMRVIRWDQHGQVSDLDDNPLVDLSEPDSGGVIPVAGPSITLLLEHGLQITLEMPTNGSARTGDYWCFAVRTADASVEVLEQAPPLGIHHHYCRLAVVRSTGEQFEAEPVDCRPRFPPLTQLFRFFHVGGDGQEVGPQEFLPQPLQVGVNNGGRPVAGAQVAFEITQGNGRLRAAASGLHKRLVVETDAQGIAACDWRLDVPHASQRVQATLLNAQGRSFVDDADHNLATPLYFNAKRETALASGGCRVTVGQGGTFERLDQAIVVLLEKGERDLCLCLLAGDHESKGLNLTPELAAHGLHLSLSGCGQASRLHLVEAGWRLQGLQAVTLQDLTIEPAFPVNDADGAITLSHCAQVTMTGCTLRGFTPEGPLLTIKDADQARLRDNRLEASTSSSLSVPQKVFTGAKMASLANLFGLPAEGEFSWKVFREKAAEVAGLLTKLKLQERKAMQKRLQTALGRQGGVVAILSNGERLNLQKLVRNLAAKQPTPDNLLDIILDIRRAAIKARPGLALVLGGTASLQIQPEAELGVLDEDDLISLEGNEIAGILSLYGLPASEDVPHEVLTAEFLKSLAAQVSKHILQGLMGTLSLHGNQLVSMTLSEAVIKGLQAAVATGKADLFGLFARCLLSDNVIEGEANLIVVRHLTMNANEFSLTAAKVLPFALTHVPQQGIGTVIADSSIYTGNHAQKSAVLTDFSGTTAQAANLALQIK